MGRSAGEGQERQSIAEAARLRLALAWAWAALVAVGAGVWLDALAGLVGWLEPLAEAAVIAPWPVAGIALVKTAQARRSR